MVTKKIRTEYMKKFRDPKWETFSKCYEDSLKYRLTRRVMEHSHKPWFWEGWDNGSESSGWSTPRISRNKIAPLSVRPSTSLDGVRHKLWDFKSNPELKPSSEDVETEVEAGEAQVVNATPPTEGAVLENGVTEADQGSAKEAPNNSGPSDDAATDDGPADRGSSDEEPAKPEPKRRHRHRTPRSEPGHRDSSHDDQPAPVRKPSRAKSQPPVSTKEKENRQPSGRHDWTERQTEVRRNTHESHGADAGAQTRREADKRSSNLDRRRARSADLEKLKRSELTVVDDRWMTEYMRCFSARLR